MMAASRYQPSMSAAKKQAPHPTRRVFPYEADPSAVAHNDPAAKPKPMVAHTKIRTKIALVLREQSRKMKDSMARASG